MKKYSLLLFLLPLISFRISIAQNEILSAPPVVKTRVIKTDFFAPATGNLTFGYEQILTNSVTLEGSLGIIGVGFIEDSYNPAGMFIKVGPRLYFTPDYLFEGMKRYNDFQGAYFKPEIVYSGFGFDETVYHTNTGIYSSERGVNNSVAVLLNLGKQWVLAKVVTLDLYAGIGYSTSFIDAKGSNTGNFAEWGVPYKYSHLEIPETPLALAAGFNIGVLIK